jgi:hypothetical protein
LSRQQLLRLEVAQRGLVPARDAMATMGIVNAVIAAFSQFCPGIIPMVIFLKELPGMWLWVVLCACTLVLLHFTWYRYLASPDEV